MKILVVSHGDIAKGICETAKNSLERVKFIMQTLI